MQLHSLNAVCQSQNTSRPCRKSYASVMATQYYAARVANKQQTDKIHERSQLGAILGVDLLQFRVLQARLLVPGERPLLVRIVRVAAGQLRARDDAVAGRDPCDGEAFAVEVAVAESLGGGVVDPAARAAAVGDGGGGLVGGADADAHVVAKQVSEMSFLLHNLGYLFIAPVSFQMSETRQSH